MKDFDKLLKLIDTIIPKPQSKEDFKIKGEGIRRKEKARVNHRGAVPKRGK